MCQELGDFFLTSGGTLTEEGDPSDHPSHPCWGVESLLWNQADQLQLQRVRANPTVDHRGQKFEGWRQNSRPLDPQNERRLHCHHFEWQAVYRKVVQDKEATPQQMDFSGDKPGYWGIQIYLLPDYWWWVPVVGGKYETKKVLLGQSVRFKWMVCCPRRVH